MSITGAASVAGIVGYPVEHSMSPMLHGYWIREYGLNAAYVPFKISPPDFSAAIDGLRKAGVRGVNVTIPHKQAAFAIATRIDATAQAAGAANLLVFGADAISAFNTDSLGLVATLDAALGVGALREKSAVVLGAGGMARAAICGLAALGVSRIALLVRTPAKGQVLADELASKVSASLSVGDFSAWADAAASAAAVVNATSAGMGNRAPLGLPLSSLAKGAVVFDSVYTPLETPLLRQARADGFVCVDGLELLMRQAVPSFEAFFGIRPEITPALRAYLIKALGLG